MRIVLLLFFYFQIGVKSSKICFEDTSEDKKDCEPDYYWRDFRGKIPEDAIEGGRTASGQPFYVAQAYFRYNELLPASLLSGKTEAVASAYNKVLKTNTDIKILCSPNKNSLRWMSIESKDLHKLNNVYPVVGGSEVGQTLYIGRVFDETSTVLGKIFKHSQSNRGLWVPSNGHEANYLSYDVLTYVCDSNSVGVTVQ